MIYINKKKEENILCTIDNIYHCKNIKCSNCVFCQIKNKKLCSQCSKCKNKLSVDLNFIKNHIIQIYFKNGLQIDADNNSIEYKDYNQSEITKHANEIESFFENLKDINRSEKLKMIFSQYEIYEIATMINDSLLNSFLSKEFTDYYFLIYDNNKNINTNMKFKIINFLLNHPKSENNKNSKICNDYQIEKILINPSDIKYTLDIIVDKPIKFLILIKNKCTEEKALSTIRIITDFSISFIMMILINYFKMKLISFINSKDLLDIVQLDQFEESKNINTFFSHFDVFDCQIYPSFTSNLSKYSGYFTENKGKINSKIIQMINISMKNMMNQ